jgi:hypothetical protein
VTVGAANRTDLTVDAGVKCTTPPPPPVHCDKQKDCGQKGAPGDKQSGKQGEKKKGGAGTGLIGGGHVGDTRHPLDGNGAAPAPAPTAPQDGQAPEA